MNNLKVASLAMVALAVAAGCGDDGDTSESSSSSASSSSGSGAGGTGGGGATGGGGGMGTGGMGTGGAATGGMGAGGMASGGGGTGGSGGAGPMVNVNITVLDVLSQMPAAGMNVCDHANANNCGTTNPQGQVTLTLPDADVTIDYSGPNYRLHLLTVRQSALAGNVNTLAISNAAVSALFGIVGGSDDPTKGQVGSGANVAGAMASLTPMSGAGPFYSDTNGFPNPALTSTTSAGTFLLTNVDPGMIELGVTHPNLTCAPDIGVVGSQPNQAQSIVEPGAITIVSTASCQ